MKADHSDTPLIRVVLFPESTGKDEVWVAHCLELDIVAQGKTAHDAQESFKRTLVGHVCLAHQQGRAAFPNGFPIPSNQLAHQSPKSVLRGLSISYSRLQHETIEPAI